MLEMGICLGVYLLSLFLVWRYIHLSHSSIGIFRDIETNVIDFYVTMIPVINTFAACIWWIKDYPILRLSKNYDKFFKIKK